MTLTEPHPLVTKPWAIRDLPPFPPIASRVLGMAARENVQLKELSETVSSDAVFAAEVLRIANSALFSVKNDVRTLLRGVTLLGLERIKALALSVAMRNYVGGALKLPVLRRCWRHNLACAVLAEELAPIADTDRDYAYTCGLMHDIGRVALVVGYPREYENLILTAEENAFDVITCERDLFDIDHCEAGRWLVREWRLPEEFEKVAAEHHHPLESARLDMVGLIALSCKMADAIGFAAIPFKGQLSPGDLLRTLSPAIQERFPANSGMLKRKVESRIGVLDPTH